MVTRTIINGIDLSRVEHSLTMIQLQLSMLLMFCAFALIMALLILASRRK